MGSRMIHPHVADNLKMELDMALEPFRSDLGINADVVVTRPPERTIW